MSLYLSSTKLPFESTTLPSSFVLYISESDLGVVALFKAIDFLLINSFTDFSATISDFLQLCINSLNSSGSYAGVAGGNIWSISGSGGSYTASGRFTDTSVTF